MAAWNDPPVRAWWVVNVVGSDIDLRKGESRDLFPVSLWIAEDGLNPDPSIISSKINCVDVEGINSSFEFGESLGPAASCCSGIFVAGSRVVQAGGVSEVAGDGVREVLGNRALYISFLRGFPVPMRRAVVGAPGRSAEDGRDGGGMFVEDEILTGVGTWTGGRTWVGDKTLAGGGTLVEVWLFADSIGFP